MFISKLWIKALNEVEELGEEGEFPLGEFIRIFAKRFSNTVMVKDQVILRSVLMQASS